MQEFLKIIFPEEQFTKDELDIILPCFEKVIFAKNDFLLQEGKIASSYFFLEKGFVRSFAIDTEGKDISTGFYGEKDIVIDWPSFFLRMPTKENMQALTECTCWQLGYDTFQHLFNTIESFRESGRRRLVSSYFGLKKHSISMITDPAAERYKKLLQEKPELFQHVPLKQIATFLGITDTSLSRIRKEIAG